MRRLALVPLLAALLLPALPGMDATIIAPLPPPAVRTKLPAGESPIELSRLAVDVKVRGLFAEVTGTLTVFNPNARPLEGELELDIAGAAGHTGVPYARRLWCC